MLASGNIEFEVKQNSLFPAGPGIKCFVIKTNSKVEKKSCEEMVCFTPAGSQIRLDYKPPLIAKGAGAPSPKSRGGT